MGADTIGAADTAADPPVLMIRPYRAGDAERTLEVFWRAIRGTAAADYSQEQIDAWADPTIDPDAWAARRAASDTIVAVLDDRVVGFSDLDGNGYIDMLFVDPDVGRRGVASALIDSVVRSALLRNIPQLTTHASRTARPFFETQSFVVAEERHPVIRGVQLTNYLMRRVL